MEIIQTEVLVVGGGTGGVAAAIQAARRGAKTILVSEWEWLGGMLTTAGVTAPDGLELAAFQTGIWGAFLQALRKQPQGLDHGWVSFFTYEPRVGAAIFADWVRALPNLRWISGQVPLEVHQRDHAITAVRFADYLIQAQITLDATELGDLLGLAEVPFRWGWEWQSGWQEPSAPVHPSTLTQTYPVQAPTWVFVLQDFGDERAPSIEAPSADHSLDDLFSSDLFSSHLFGKTWEGYGSESFLNYGRLPGNRFMINWPQRGNDYGLEADRLIRSDAAQQAFLADAYLHAQRYAHFLQQQLGRRYGLATGIFPSGQGLGKPLGGGAYALHPYYRESRRLQGCMTVREQDILPMVGGQVAALPTLFNDSNDSTHSIRSTEPTSAIAIGNYANDHHYPGFQFALHPKSIRWGGRWTGTPFALPYGCLIPEAIDRLLVCEKNISVSHIANGATRLQPTVLGIGQAAGMAAALCIEQNCQPRELPVSLLQAALLQDPIAPMAVVPLFNVMPDHPDWLSWQRYYLAHPENYPIDGNAPIPQRADAIQWQRSTAPSFSGYFHRQTEQDYSIELPSTGRSEKFSLVTLHPEVERQLRQYPDGQPIQGQGWINRSGQWLRVESIG